MYSKSQQQQLDNNSSYNKRPQEIKVLEINSPLVNFQQLGYQKTNYNALVFNFYKYIKLKSLPEGANFIKSVKNLISKKKYNFYQADITIERQPFLAPYIDLIVMCLSASNALNRLSLSIKDFPIEEDENELKLTMSFLEKSQPAFNLPNLEEFEIIFEKVEIKDVYVIGQQILENNFDYPDRMKHLKFHLDCIYYSEKRQIATNLTNSTISTTIIPSLFKFQNLNTLDINLGMHLENKFFALVFREEKLQFKNLKNLNLQFTLPSFRPDIQETNVDTTFPLYVFGELIYFAPQVQNLQIGVKNVLLQDLEIEVFEAFTNFRAISSLQSCKIEFYLMPDQSTLKEGFIQEIVKQAIFPYNSQYLVNFEFRMFNAYMYKTKQQSCFKFLQENIYLTKFQTDQDLWSMEDSRIKYRKAFVYKMYLYKKTRNRNQLLFKNLFNRKEKFNEFISFLTNSQDIIFFKRIDLNYYYSSSYDYEGIKML